MEDKEFVDYTVREIMDICNKTEHCTECKFYSKEGLPIFSFCDYFSSPSEWFIEM